MWKQGLLVEEKQKVNLGKKVNPIYKGKCLLRKTKMVWDN